MQGEHEHEIVVSEETINELIEVRRLEAKVRIDEISADKHAQETQKALGLESIKAQKDYLEKEMIHSGKESTKTKVFAIVLFFGLIGFVITLIALSQAKLAEEIIKSLGLVIAGGFGGYGLAKHHERQEE